MCMHFRHHIKGALPQALLLAGPGVLMGAFIMGQIVYGLSLNWSWNLSMLFAAIVSATDPVAVVGLLKNTNASPKLTILIIGESLLNDGTAMVLFTLYFELMKGHAYSHSFVFGYFIRMTLGSPLVGITIGLIAVQCMSYATKPLSTDDVTVQIAITFCTAYMTFYVAEYELHVSGLLACCAAGAMMSWKGPPLILNHDSMHQVWSMLEWVGNTLLFLLAGCIIGSDIISDRTASDWGHLLLLYVLLNILRMLIVAVLYPLLSTVGLRCSRKDAVFLSWAGLRGALGMALALIVKDNRKDANISENDANQLFFLVGGIAAFTLVINATTAEIALYWLGLLQENTADKVMVMEQVYKTMRVRLWQEAEELQRQLHITDISGILAHNSLLRTEKKEECSHKGGEVVHPLAISPRDSTANVPGELLTRCVRAVFLDIVRVEYWRRIANGRLPRFCTATESLLYSIDHALDKVDTGLGDWDVLKHELELSSCTRCGAGVIERLTSEFSPLRTMADMVYSQNEEYQVYVLMNFIEAHEYAQRKLCEFMGIEEKVDRASDSGRIPETAQVLLETSESVSPRLTRRDPPVFLLVLFHFILYINNKMICLIVVGV